MWNRTLCHYVQTYMDEFWIQVKPKLLSKRQMRVRVPKSLNFNGLVHHLLVLNRMKLNFMCQRHQKINRSFAFNYQWNRKSKLLWKWKNMRVLLLWWWWTEALISFGFFTHETVALYNIKFIFLTDVIDFSV